MSIAAFFHKSQGMEVTEVPVNRQMDKEVRILPSNEQEWDNAIFSNMDRPRDYRIKSEEKDKYVISRICGI